MNTNPCPPTVHIDQAIGVFDSGVGGLTVAKEMKRLMPNEDIIYFGDTKHLPYGDKSKEAITQYCLQITNFLLEKKCKAIVVACNSATANAIEEIRKVIGSKALLFDVIHPVAEKCAFEIHQKIGVIATKATVQTHLYKKSIRKHNKYIQVEELATPLFVPVIEEGLSNHSITREVVQHYLSDKKLDGIETLILGCTHYPLLAKEISQFYKGRVNVIDSPHIVASHVQMTLAQHKLLHEEKKVASYKFYLSDITKNFQRIAKKFFGNAISLELLDLEHREEQGEIK